MDTERFDRLVKSLSTAGTRRRLLRLVAPVSMPGALLTRLAEVAQGQRNGTVVDDGGQPSRNVRYLTNPGDGKDMPNGTRLSKDQCASVGQTPNSVNRRRCCKGLSKDASGRCVVPWPPAPPVQLCIGLVPTDDLQASIDAASPGKTITLCPGTWELTSTVHITQDLTLKGAGARRTVLDGGGNPIRVLHIATGATVKVQGLTITNGVSSAGFDGGGIENKGTLRLLGVTVKGNKSESGGGIANFGTLTLAAGRVTGNTADVDGGGIFNDGTVTLKGGSRVSGNTAGSSGGGIYIKSGLATLKGGSRVMGNATGSEGGGVYNVSGNLSLEGGSSIKDNTANFAGGGISNLGSVTLAARSSVKDNTANFAGGGIYNDGGLVTLERSITVSGNIPDNCEPEIGACT